MDFPPFPGFRDEAFDFFRQLAEHNEREWFKPRKDVYEDEVLWPFRCLIADVTRRAPAEGLPYSGDPKGAIFRIYRDVRFSKNKNPYKTHAAAVLTRSGNRKDEKGGCYLHMAPGDCLMAVGFWRPETAVLRRWRARMAANPASFLHMAERLADAGYEIKAREQLKRMPRGFDVDPDDPIAPYLRYKSFVTSRTFPEEALQTPDFTDAVLEVMRDTLPLMEYGWDLVDPQQGTDAEAGRK